MHMNPRARSCWWGIALSVLVCWVRAPALLAHELKHGGSTGETVTPVALQAFTPTDALAQQLGTLPRTLATLFGPSLAVVIRHGRERAYPSGHPMPQEIRATLAPFFARAVLERVRYVTSRDAAAEGTVSQVLVSTGAVEALTLGDVIVFRDAQSARDPLLWAHELVHVEQYRRLGVEAFAAQYLQQAWVLETEAVTKAKAIQGQLSR
jgi:hypothetical protein